MIGLMDCNNFFVSCERLFRPDLLKKPVIVLTSNDGCVVARSQEVKDLGVPMGIPYFEVKDLCIKHGVTLFSSNFPLYRDISLRVMDALKSEFDSYEIYSIDEAFFEVSQNITTEEIAEIRARVIQKTGIPVSIGIAKTKTLAKVANSIAKKGTGVCIMDTALWQQTQKDLLCGSIWGIGRQTSATLSKYKIYTVFDLLRQDTAFLKQILGVFGERIILELSGTSVYPIGGLDSEKHQSYMSTRSFSRPIQEKHLLEGALGYHVAHIAEKLRRDACIASKVSILARGSRFGAFATRKGSIQTILDVPTNDTMFLTNVVIRLFDHLYDPEIPYKKVGVILSGIQSIDEETPSLFGESSHDIKYNTLNTVTDILNERFGTGTIHLGTALPPEKWNSNRNFVSHEYTTKWDEICIIKAK